MTKEKKQEIIAAFARKEGDVGSPEVQIALLTERITELTAHMKQHKKDYSTSRGLVTMVNNRKKLLKYLNRENHTGYLEITEKLNIRRAK